MLIKFYYLIDGPASASIQAEELLTFPVRNCVDLKVRALPLKIFDKSHFLLIYGFVQLSPIIRLSWLCDKILSRGRRGCYSFLLLLLKSHFIAPPSPLYAGR